MSQRWNEAQAGESNWWLTVKEDVLDPGYRQKINDRANKVEEWIENYSKIKKDSKLLEIGGGATQLIDFFKNGARFAIDPLADVYKKEFSEVLNPDIVWKSDKAEKISFENETFDVILSRNVLDHVESFQISLKEIHRVLKKDGFFYIGLNTFTGLYYFYKLIKTDPEHPYTFTPASLKKELEKAGFEVIDAVYDAEQNMQHFTDDLVSAKMSVRKILLETKSLHFTEFLLKKR